jgi:hypothetical protein
MRKITQQAVNAFLNETPISIDNTRVSHRSGITILTLHGNEIARKNWNGKNEIEISNAGWFSNTTKERLNGLPSVSIQQKKGQWYLNGQKWDGKWTKVK